MFKWIVKNPKATNAIFLEEENNQEGRPFKSRFLQAGLVKYDFGVCLLKKETIDKFINTFINCPVIINHQDDINQNDIVGTIKNIWFSPEDGWFWCDGVVTDKKAIDLIEKGYNISCQYRITDYIDNTENKLHNANPYDKEILNGVFEHLAIVENPRYEDAFIAVNAYLACNDDEFEQKHSRDEYGKFSSDRSSQSSSIDFDNLEPVEFTQDDIDKFKNKGSVKEYYQNNIQGTKITHSDKRLGEIEFSGKGLGESIDKNRSKNYYLLTKIPEIIKASKYDKPEELKHPREDGIVKFHILYGKINNGRKTQIIQTKIAEDNNGKKFFIFKPVQTAKNNSTPLPTIAKDGFYTNSSLGGGGTINIIPDFSENYHPAQTKYDKILTHIRNFKGVIMNKKEKGLFHSLLDELIATNSDDEKDKDNKAANEDVDKRQGMEEVGRFLRDKGLSNEDIQFVLKTMFKDDYNKSSRGTADNSSEDEEDNKEAKNKKATNEKVDKRERIRQIMALVGELGGSDEQVITAEQWAEDISYNKSEAGTADNGILEPLVKNKCKNENGEDEQKQEEYEELKEKVYKEAENKKAKNSLDALKKAFFEGKSTNKKLYMTQKEGIELGRQLY